MALPKIKEARELGEAELGEQILAVKRQQPVKKSELMTQIQALKDFYGIQEQCLETLLKADGLL